MSDAPTRPHDGLATLLRDGTAEVHRHAERSPFVHALFRGELDSRAVVAFFAQQLPLYSAMEERLREGEDDPVLAPVRFPELWRTAALHKDLAALGDGPTEASEATNRLVERVRTVSSAQLVAHLYTRYLGDLSGGQAISKVLQKKYKLDPLAFYSFDDIDDPNAFKHLYRDRLDALPLDDATKSEVVEEAIVAFNMAREVMDSVMDLL